MIASYILLGLFTGIFSGAFGVGGAVILIPAMIYFYKMTQLQAQGTTLALMIPPIGLLAVWRYYVSGNVNIKMAIFICLGFFVGGLLGAHIVQFVPASVLKKAFGIILFFVSIKMLFF